VYWIHVALDRLKCVEGCKHGNGSSSSMKLGEVLGFLMISQHLKKDYTPERAVNMLYCNNM
jgi:hypothetical protein